MAGHRPDNVARIYFFNGGEGVQTRSGRKSGGDREESLGSGTHHGAPRVGTGRRADLRGESQSPAEAPRAGQLPVQPCMGHHAKVSRV